MDPSLHFAKTMQSSRATRTSRWQTRIGEGRLRVVPQHLRAQSVIAYSWRADVFTVVNHEQFLMQMHKTANTTTLDSPSGWKCSPGKISTENPLEREHRLEIQRKRRRRRQQETAELREHRLAQRRQRRQQETEERLQRQQTCTEAAIKYHD